ncbi:MAG: ABC transporter ATP-binding protein [Ruminococcaceae bacterium]|nr:ABC transporter ATP-binding protein [Oscillospiraceae bacterium]
MAEFKNVEEIIEASNQAKEEEKRRQEEEAERQRKEAEQRRKNPIPDYEVLFQESVEEAAVKGSGKKSGGKILKHLFLQNQFKIYWSVVLYIIKASPTWAIPLVTTNIINMVTNPDSSTPRMMLINGLVLLVLLVQNIPTHVIYAKFVDKMLRTVGAGLRNTLIKKLQHLSLAYHKELESGKIQAKFLRDIEAVEFLDAHFMKSVIPSLINILISVFIAATKSGVVTLFFLVVIPMNVILIRLFRRPLADSNRKFRKETENISAKMTNMLDMIPVTKAHGLENEEIAALEENIRRLREKGLVVDRNNAFFGSAAWVLSQVLSGVCLFFTGYLALKGQIQVGDVVLYQTYFNQISGNVQSLINLFPELTKGMESIQSVSEIVLSNQVEDNSNKLRLRYVHGSIQFKDVSFRYPNAEEDMIKNFSLDVEPGECIAFVGASGSGKSTIMNMIIGFLQPTGGEMLMDGKPINALNLVDYRKFISVVPQNSILFTGSIRDNITYGIEHVNEHQLQEVIRLANINEFTDKMPDGINTMIGEGGGKLSGGQKQRISIARALIRDPKILILDEATSALDNISEYHVQRAISHLIKGRTTFIVAHRLSTIRDADRIVVMENGRCVEMGTYDELMAKQGKFYELKTLNDMNASEG